MTDDLTVSTGSMSPTDVGSSPTGAPSSEDERIKGLQRAVSEKARVAEEAQRVNAALQARIEALELSQMSESDRASVLSQRSQASYQAVLAENERLKLGLKYPAVARHYETLINATSAEAQMQYLAALTNPQAAPAAESFSDVDSNNPMRSPTDPISLPPGSVMNAADADRILGLYGNRPLRTR